MGKGSRDFGGLKNRKSSCWILERLRFPAEIVRESGPRRRLYWKGADLREVYDQRAL